MGRRALHPRLHRPATDKRPARFLDRPAGHARPRRRAKTAAAAFRVGAPCEAAVYAEKPCAFCPIPERRPKPPVRSLRRPGQTSSRPGWSLLGPVGVCALAGPFWASDKRSPHRGNSPRMGFPASAVRFRLDLLDGYVSALATASRKRLPKLAFGLLLSGEKNSGQSRSVPTAFLRPGCREPASVAARLARCPCRGLPSFGRGTSG